MEQRKRSWKSSVTSADVLKRIWDQGMEVNKVDDEEETVLHQAAEAGSRVLVWLLLKQGVAVNARDASGRTALHRACESFHRTTERVVMLLLMSGADINLQNTMGETCLHVACWAKNRQLVALLLKHGASPKLANRFGLTPLHVVAQLKTCDSSVAKVLLVYSTAEVNAVDSVGRSPLHWASSSEAIWTASEIVQGGGNVNLQDSHGDTPLHLTCMGKESLIVYLLIKFGAKISATNIENRTALHLAALHGSLDIVVVLLYYGADVTAKDSCGDTPLHLAVSRITKRVSVTKDSLGAVVEVLLNAGAKVDVNNELQKTPLDDMLEFEKCFCARDDQATSDKEAVKQVADLFVDHVIKLKTANLHVDIDIAKSFESVNFDVLKMLYSNEVRKIKSTYVSNSLSLNEVFCHENKPYLLSSDELGVIEEYLKARDLLIEFPLYGNLLRRTFQISKLLTENVNSIDEVANDEDNSDSFVVLNINGRVRTVVREC